MINNPTYRGTVYPWHCDHVGHMNVMWYVGKFDEATWNMFADLGLTSAYMREKKRGMAAVEQHLTYLKELRAGDVVAINGRIIEARPKSASFLLEMSDAASGEICARCEITALHLDTDARKAVAFDDEIFTALQRAAKLTNESAT